MLYLAAEKIVSRSTRPVWRSVWVTVLVLVGMAVARAADPHDPATLAADKAEFARWLTAAGLSQTLAVEKLRWGSRPDAVASQWLMLELRYVAAEAEFEARFENFDGIAGLSLAETLFYKFVHLSGVARSDAVVHIFALDRDYAIFHDTQQGRLVFREGVDRGYVRQAATLDDILLNPPARKAGAVLTASPGRNDTAGLIQAFLKDYFIAQNRNAGLPPPRLALKPLEPTYAGLDVEGIKRQVIAQKNYWERLQISVDLQRNGQGLRAVCYLYGQYASGLGTAHLPAPEAYSDMDSEYRHQLEDFTADLLRKLQDAVAATRR